MLSLIPYIGILYAIFSLDKFIKNNLLSAKNKFSCNLTPVVVHGEKILSPCDVSNEIKMLSL